MFLIKKRPKLKDMSCAVIIPSHNYGQYVSEAIESVLAQSVPASDILVVDDYSNDDTKKIVEKYSGKNVRYIYVENKNAHNTRCGGALNAIKHNPNLQALAFLDADNKYHPEYLETGLPLLSQSNIAVVYPNMQVFGFRNLLLKMPDYNWNQMMCRNCIDASSIIKRDAFEQSKVWESDISLDTAEDWVMFRKILNNRWHAVKNPTPLYYRTHKENKSEKRRNSISNRPTSTVYYQDAGLYTEDITIFMPLSGRKKIWESKTVNFLEKQTWPHSQTKLIICDTSHDQSFGETVKSWLYNSDYGDVHYYKQDVGSHKLAEKDRRKGGVQHEVNMAVARIYNNLMPKVSTEFLLIIEDDNIPEFECAQKLLSSFSLNTFSVTAPYIHKYWPDQLVAWYWSEERAISQGGQLLKHEKLKREHFSPPQLKYKEGAEDIGGNGFGTVMLRTSIIKNYPFVAMAPPFQFFDVALYYWVYKLGLYTVKINWDVASEHIIDEFID